MATPLYPFRTPHLWVAADDPVAVIGLGPRHGARLLEFLGDLLEPVPVAGGVAIEVHGTALWARWRRHVAHAVSLAHASITIAAGQREQWRALIATMELALRLLRHKPGSLVGMDEYLYRRTGGMIGSLSQLIRGGAILAIENRSEAVTRDLLDIVPVDYAAERADVARTGAGRVKRAAS
jgi:hypothetical protein